MSSVVVDKPYRFFPPTKFPLMPFVLRYFVRWRLARAFGITEVECREVERLRVSLSGGSGVLLAPNHSHPADPFVLVELGRLLGFSPYIMASWHLFMGDRLTRFLLQQGRVFSVYREGLDRQALNQAIEILSSSSVPLVIFPEGVISRHNYRLNPLMEGISLITSAASKKRAAVEGKAGVLVHPIALEYRYLGEESAIEEAMAEIESRLSWREAEELARYERLVRLGGALLGLKEIEYIGVTQSGSIVERCQRLIDCLLAPIEAEWVQGRSDGGTVARVKRLRIAVLPDLVKGDIDEAERQRRWRQLKDMDLAQQIHCYAPNYVQENPSIDRYVETLERLEEDLSGAARIYSSRKAILTVGEAIKVEPGKSKQSEPLLEQVEKALSAMLGINRAL